MIPKVKTTSAVNKYAQSTLPLCELPITFSNSNMIDKALGVHVISIVFTPQKQHKNFYEKKFLVKILAVFFIKKQ